MAPGQEQLEQRTQPERPPRGVDPEAWLAEHGDLLYRYAVARLGRREDAEDAVQEALLAGLRAAASFDARSSVSTWLVGILRHKVHDVLRRRSRDGVWRAAVAAALAAPHPSGFTPEGYWAEPNADWGVDLSDPAEREEFIRALEAAIAGLPAVHRQVVYLCEIDGLGAREAADLLGLSRTNLWTIAHRARQRLRRDLDQRLADRKMNPRGTSA